MTCLGNNFQILNFNYFKIIVEFDLNPNLKIFDLPNNKFEPILNFQMRLSFSNMTKLFKFVVIFSS